LDSRKKASLMCTGTNSLTLVSLRIHSRYQAHPFTITNNFQSRSLSFRFTSLR